MLRQTQKKQEPKCMPKIKDKRKKNGGARLNAGRPKTEKVMRTLSLWVELRHHEIIKKTVKEKIDELNSKTV